ncbi:tRNA-dihydrouridine synthase [Cupriavidus taiwanensis]|uniref:oxidoreductase n=1 Tax=Cupriavidus taiwanensis TaxID=164546 RepID=UPI000E106A03|nr:NADH:flavin oxidoreductase [Cupriavidus taiwanensis]SOY59545.1 putative NADH:flavin oxidoreductase [Cupriavidus taiwanensis]SOY59938.1 putative NADH:flavin oxidoreductase [Cupriavidus taiwanensis]SOY91977.1 putative NADH:flavin oxidoreductase [Cupriavidus taiwanensis]SOZ65844.1 putative NADH:flavin oxidoreductase [Cupriavidus taiwanensis]SOZ83526.1 putative NADH:flavin oxidoreductase [Cupriavidus taiwanensis]
MTTPAAPSLFDTPALNGVPLRNRLVVAPMTRISATDAGVPTAAMCRYYGGFARGGFGLIVSEGIYTDRAYAQGYAGQPGLTDAQQAQGWRGIVDAVHHAGGRMIAQLMHAGALSQANRFRDDTAGPSAVQPRGRKLTLYGGTGAYRMPRAMDQAEILQAVDGFAQAARLARDAGFDGVEIHGANGYLLDQFLNNHTNLRQDGWGGAIAQRMRLLLETIRAVRAAAGNDVIVGVRISQAKVNDFTYQWPEGADGAATLFGAIAASGVDYLHVTEHEAWQPAFADGAASLVQHARRAAPGLAIVANGSLAEPERAAAMLAQGATLVALGRGALANPDWPARVRAGRPVRRFDAAVLAPLAGIKDAELALREAPAAWAG